MQETIGTRINKLMEAQGKQTQQQLADAIGVSRELVKAWIRGSRRIQIDDLVKLAKHFNVSTDYLLGLSTAQKINSTLRFIEECIGLSTRSISTIANANGRIFSIMNTIKKDDFDHFFDDSNYLDQDAAESLDHLVSYGDGKFLKALAVIKRLSEEVEDVKDNWRKWESNRSGDPPLAVHEAEQLEKELRFALFTLTEEAKESANDIYGCNDALDYLREIIGELQTIKANESEEELDCEEGQED